MQLPKRKPGKYTALSVDPHLTAAKFNELTRRLERLKGVDQPRASKEMQRLAEDGDFSENAAYQMAKGRLRGINQRILELENHLKQAILIEPSKNTDRVELGHRATIEMAGRKVSYLVLGSSETDPRKGIISGNSPLGAALLGKKVGDVITFKRAEKDVECTIVRIE